jgi:Ca2+-binding EF-hand superfamily protein
MLTFEGKATSFQPGKEVVNKEPPTNKFVVEKLYKVHRERMMKMEPVVDCHVDIPDFLTNTSWKQITEQHRRDVITKQNEVIYKRIAKAENTESLITTENRLHIKRVEHELQLMKRLKQMGRIRDILKVQRENEDLLSRIEKARPAYGGKSIREWYKHHQMFKDGRRSDPTAGHLGFKGCKGLWPKPLPPMPSPTQRALDSERKLGAFGPGLTPKKGSKSPSSLSPMSRGNMSPYPNSPFAFGIDDPMSQTMDGDEDEDDIMLQSMMQSGALFDGPLSPVRTVPSKNSSNNDKINKTSSSVNNSNSNSSGGKKKTKKGKNAATSPNSDETKNVGKNKKNKKQGGQSEKIHSISNEIGGIGSKLGANHAQYSSENSTHFVNRSENLTPGTSRSRSLSYDENTLRVEGHYTLYSQQVPVPFTEKTVILQVLLSKNFDNKMKIYLRETNEPHEIISIKETLIDQIAELVSTHGTSSIFSDSAIISDISTMRETFHKMFFEVDDDGNGYLTFDEFMVLMKKTKLGIDQADLRKILMEADDNGNGVVEFEEFYPLILDMTLSFRTINAAREIVAKRQSIIDEEVNRRMYNVNFEEGGDKLLIKIAGCDSKNTGVVRYSDLKRCLLSMAGPLQLSEDEIFMMQRMLPGEGYARVSYTTIPEVYRNVKWITCKQRMQLDLGSDIYKHLLMECHKINHDPEHTNKGMIQLSLLSEILEDTNKFDLNTIQRITLVSEAQKFALAEMGELDTTGGGMLPTEFDYHKVLPVISKAIELMLDPDMLRQRAELLDPNFQQLDMEELAQDLKMNKISKNGGGNSEVIDTNSRLKGLFQMTDINHDNTMSITEFTYCIKAVKLDLNNDEIAALFAQADKDNSGNLSFAEFAYFFETNLASIERSNHMKAIYSTLHDKSSTIKAVGGESQQLQQLKDLQEHLRYVFNTSDIDNKKKLEKNDIQTILDQIDVELSLFQKNTILSEMFCDEDGFVDLDQATTITAHLLQVFLSEEGSDKVEERASNEAISVVKNMSRDIHRIVRFFMNGIYEIDSGHPKILTPKLTADRQKKLELLVHSQYSGLAPTEANYVLHTLFNEQYRKQKSLEQLSHIKALSSTSADLAENTSRIRKRRSSISSSKFYSNKSIKEEGEYLEEESSTRSFSNAASASIAENDNENVNSNKKINTNNNEEEEIVTNADDTKLPGRTARSSIINSTKNHGNHGNQGALGAHQVVHKRKTVIAKSNWTPTEQELTDAVAAAKKETIMRAKIQTLDPKATTRAIFTSFEHAKDVLVMQGKLEEDDKYVPVRVAYEILCDGWHFRLSHGQIMAMIVQSKCFDRTDTMIEYRKFSNYCGSAIQEFHFSSHIEKRAKIIELIHNENQSNKKNLHLKCLHGYDSLAIGEVELDNYLLKSFLAAEDGRGQVSEKEFVRILSNIPGVVLTTKDAIIVSSGFPHTKDGSVSWQRFLPWAYTTISSLCLEHMIKRRLLLMEIDSSTMMSNEQNKIDSRDNSRPSTQQANGALKEMIKLADNAMELIKIRHVITEDENNSNIKNETVLALFPFDFDEIEKKIDANNLDNDEGIIASLDSLSIEQGDDGSITELYSGQNCGISAVVVEPLIVKKQRPSTITTSPITITANVDNKQRKTALARPTADSRTISPVKVNVQVVAVERLHSVERDLMVTVTGEYEYPATKKEKSQLKKFDVSLETPIIMPSMCLIDPESAAEFAESIPEKLLIEFTQGGAAEPRLILKGSPTKG